MPRTYDRDTVKWELDVLQSLAALDPPQAVFYEKANRWVVKEPNGPSYGVRPEQIVDAQAEQAAADDAAERRYNPPEYLGGSIYTMPELAAARAEIAKEEAQLAEEADVPISRHRDRDEEIDDLMARFTKGGTIPKG